MERAITLIEGIDVGDVPPTPNATDIDSPYLDGIREQLVNRASEHGLFPVSYKQEQKGKLIQNILPIKKTETQQISTSSGVELGLHTELAFHPYRPSAVFLLCLRGDSTAVTTYAHVDDIVKHIQPVSLVALTRLWYITTLDDSFRTGGEEDMELYCPILRGMNVGSTGANPLYEITFDEVLMRGTNEQAEQAINELKAAIKLCVKEIVLKTGDLLILNNKTTIHGRRPFQARYDGTDRWVQRMLAVYTLPPVNQIEGHVITTPFAKKKDLREALVNTYAYYNYK